MSGFATIGLYKPKTAENVGGALRASYCYGVSAVSIQGGRGGFLNHVTNTPKGHRHSPVYMTDDLLLTVPFDTQIVVVDMIPGAVSLVDFVQPRRAMYLFGPEDGSLGKIHTDRAQHVVYIPTRTCMNLAACVNVVLYDRMAKQVKA